MPRSTPLSSLAARALALVACVSAIPSLAAGPSTNVVIRGDVATPQTLTSTDLQARPAITQTVTFASGTTPQTHTYVGASLYGTLDAAGVSIDAALKNDILDKFVVATGSDGYRVVMSLGELSPQFGARPDLIAYAENVAGVVRPLTTDGFARLTAPGDAKGGRYVSNLVSLEVGSAVARTTGGGGPSTRFTVGGDVARDASFDASSLAALASTTQTVGGVTYTGVSLWSLLTSTIGVPLDPAVKNDQLGKYVVATGSDGYSVVFSLGELDPSFGGQPDFIAYLANGVPLTSDGFARIVVPNDVRAGRWVSNLVSLEVFSIPECGTMLLWLIGLSAIGLRRGWGRDRSLPRPLALQAA